MGTSLVENDKIDLALEIMQHAEQLGKKLLIPVDLTVADGIEQPETAQTVAQKFQRSAAASRNMINFIVQTKFFNRSHGIAAAHNSICMSDYWRRHGQYFPESKGL